MEKQIQDTLEELCVADLVDNYCAACASGGGCCAQCSDDGSSEEFLLTSKTVYTTHSTDMASYCSINRVKDIQDDDFEALEQRMIEEEQNEATNQENISCEGDDFTSHYVNSELNEQSLLDLPNLEHKPRQRRHLRIDLSNEEDLSDGEILKRLLSPTESFNGDQPLEVILEIVGEEEEVDNGYLFPSDENPAVNKSFQSLRDQLKNSSLFSNYQDEEISGYPLENVDRNSENIIGELRNENLQREAIHLPSYEKANALMNEIESCFMETAQIVERTLGSSSKRNNSTKTAKHQPTLKNISDSQEVDANQQKLTQTVQEALQIFDSIISDHQNKRDRYESNLHQYSNDIHPLNNYIPNNNLDTNTLNQDNYYSDSNATSSENFMSLNDQKAANSTGFQPKALGNHFWRRYSHSFDKDVDELFRQCYELSAVEPSDSLVSCLKNLENLCLQLRKAKEHILQEISDHRDEPIAVINEDKLALINELLERKLKSKLKIEKFTVVPPIMGLEGKTHKIIAEVSPPSNLEMGDGYPHYLQKYPQLEDEHDYVNVPNLNAIQTNLNDFHDSAFDSNSDMSIATTHFDSNSSGSNSRNLIQATSDENGYQNSVTDSLEDDRNAILSYEDSIALYEDNQELQQSLLSILHSLNDIHDNFLKRRKQETSIAHDTSIELHNSIIASLHNDNLIQTDHLRTQNLGKKRLSSEYQNKYCISLIDKMSEDFESIENIRKVSDELKNLWLYHSEDLITSKQIRQKPSRSLSLSRNYRPKRYSRNRQSLFSSEEETSQYSSEQDDESVESNEHLNLRNEMSYSMPNLNFDISSEDDSENTDELVESMGYTEKEYNDKSNDVTLNFLKRMMEACQILDGDPESSSKLNHHLLDSKLMKHLRNHLIEQDEIPDRHSRRSIFDYNASMRTY